MSELYWEEFFKLTSADVAAIRPQFRSDHRLPPAAWLKLMFVRVAYRPLYGAKALTRVVLRHPAKALAVCPL